MPLPASTNEGFTATRGATDVNEGTALQPDFAGRDMHGAAFACQALRVDLPVYFDQFFGFEGDFAALA